MANNDPINIRLADLEQTSAELDYVAVVPTTGRTMQCPVRLGLKPDGSDLWTLPLEPLVSVKGGKRIIKRNIAQPTRIGTVKEQWNQDDYEIQVVGMFQGKAFFPEADISRLESLMVKGQSVQIRCKLLDVLGIDMICIESWLYNATPGLENQTFSFTGSSDQYFDLS